MLLPAANVSVSEIESAMIFDCPLTAIVLKLFANVSFDVNVNVPAFSEIAKLLFADWNVIVSPFVIVLLSLADATVKLVAFAPALIPSNFVLSVFVKLFCVNPPSPTVYSVLTELTWIVFPVLVTVVAPSCWKSITSPELINVPVSPPDCSEALIVNPL